MSNNDDKNDDFKLSNSSESSETITVIEDKKDNDKNETNNDKNCDLINDQRSAYELII